MKEKTGLRLTPRVSIAGSASPQQIAAMRLGAIYVNKLVQTISVFDCSHSKGRSGAENGRGRGNQTRTGLHFFRTGTLPDFFLQV
jgi:hypothetical protein